MMPNHLFFITSVNEARAAISRIKKLKKESVHSTIVSSDPLASIFLKVQGIEFSDIGNYYPPPRRVITAKKQLRSLMEEWNLNHRLNRLIGYSLDAYLAEILHSLITAEEILKQTKPSLVHVSPRWSESPFRRYQSEKLNLENIALFQLAKQHRLRILTFKIPFSQTIPAYAISFFLTSIWQSLRTSYRQLFRPAPAVKSNKLIIMANYYQLENLIPVIKELKKQNRQFTVIGKISPEQNKRLANLIPAFIPLETLEKQKKSFRQIRLIKMIVYSLKLIVLFPSLKHFFSLKNQKYWQFLFPKFLYYFMVEFPLLTDYLDGASRLFKQGKLLVTSATADNVSQTIAMSAKSENVTVLELQHGVLPGDDDDVIFRTNDFFAVWGKSARETISDTRNPDKIPVTGYPHFDHYWYPHPIIIHRQAIREKLKVSSSTKVLLILSVFPLGITRIYPNYSPYQFMEMIFKILTPAKSEWKVIFRPHPSVPSPWVSDLAKNSGINFCYDQQKLKLKDAITASDVIIANPSTTVIEAMFQKKPILLCDFPSEGEAYSYSSWPMVAADAVELFITKSQLNKLISKSIYDQNFLTEMAIRQELFLKSYCSAFSKPATSRVVSLINRLCP